MPTGQPDLDSPPKKLLPSHSSLCLVDKTKTVISLAWLLSDNHKARSRCIFIFNGMKVLSCEIKDHYQPSVCSGIFWGHLHVGFLLLISLILENWLQFASYLWFDYKLCQLSAFLIHIYFQHWCFTCYCVNFSFLSSSLQFLNPLPCGAFFSHFSFLASWGLWMLSRPQSICYLKFIHISCSKSFPKYALPLPLEYYIFIS